MRGGGGDEAQARDAASRFGVNTSPSNLMAIITAGSLPSHCQLEGSALRDIDVASPCGVRAPLTKNEQGVQQDRMGCSRPKLQSCRARAQLLELSKIVFIILKMIDLPLSRIYQEAVRWS
jgi:hypothetical protein